MTMPSFSKPNSLRTNFSKPRSGFQDMLPFGKHYIMRSDVKETDTMYQLDVDLPGFQKENIKAYVKDGYLIIEASKEQEKGKESKQYIRKERYEGTYRRTFYVGSTVRQEDVKASYKHGVLHLHIPKKALEEVKPDMISIN